MKALRKENEFFELFHEIFMMVPAWTCIPAAAIAFAIINVIIVAFASSNPIAKGFAGLAPMLGGFAAILILIAGGRAALGKTARKELFEKQTGIDPQTTKMG